MSLPASAYAICFCGTRIQLFATSFKPVENARLLVEFPYDNGSKTPAIDAVTNVSRYLFDHGYRQQPVFVGLDCFQALLIRKPEDLPGKTAKTNSLEISLEETCPVDAENMFAAELNRNQILIVIKDRVQPLIEVIAEQGINVRYVVPTAILIARTLLRDKSLPLDCRLLLGTEHVEVVEVREHRISNWTFANQLLSLAYGPLDNLPEYSISSTTHNESESNTNGANQLNFESVLAQGLSTIVHDRFDPELVSFRQLCGVTKQPPIIRALQMVGISIAFLLASLTIANVWRSCQADQAVRQIDSHAARLHTETFPDAPPTRLIARALKTARDKLAKQAGLLEKTQSTARIVDSLYAIVNSVPNDYTIHVNTIQISNSKVVLLGNASSLESLDQLKSRIEKCGLLLIQNEQEYGTTFKLSYMIPDEFNLPVQQLSIQTGSEESQPES